jgi:uncharacterized protein YndB with AHSA1/START domain
MRAERRRHVEITVPGSPDEVWDAIATREGTVAWAFAADIGENTVTIHREPFGPDAEAFVTAWEPPHRFAYEEPIGPERPPLATEFLVEARDRGTCVVRVVTGFTHAGEEWEDLLDGAAEGWRMSLLVLRACRTHFAGQVTAMISATVNTGRPVADRDAVAERLLGRLGVAGLAAGEEFCTPDGAPSLAGTVEFVSTGYVLLRAAEPAPGLFAISAFPMADPAVSVNVVGHLFGPAVADAARREEKRWQDWLASI